ncbi:MAG: anhydro-N-acetylmuramic acid kinase, partial [Chloroflexi bacterium]
RDGRLAASGAVDSDLLEALLAHPYFARRPPKTTGREVFGRDFLEALWQRARARGLPPEDVVATVTALTAHAIARAYRAFLPTFPDEVILSGGGVHNPVLVGMLRDLLAPAVVLTTDDVGIPVDTKEALSFALLAYETWHGRVGNMPAATGARHSVILGSITPQAGRMR